MVMVKERSTITAKGQTTVPVNVRKVLGVGIGDKIDYVYDNKRGELVLRAAADEEEEDPVIGAFLDFLAKDMEKNPLASIVAFPEGMAACMADLADGIEVDLDEVIEGSVSL